VVPSQPRQIVLETLSQKTLHKNRAGRVAQGEGPEFKLQYHKTKKQKQNIIVKEKKLIEIRTKNIDYFALLTWSNLR
jgi:hypothetical protein